MVKTEEGFEEASSDNLPKVDSDMVQEFFVNNLKYLSSEIRNVKTNRSTKESYGDNAISYVQLKRNGDICVVLAKITPEHKIHKKAYNLRAEINEEEECINLCCCMDCSAAEGGCKHGVAFLLWLHRRSEEPATTSKLCYWKASSLAKVGKTADLRLSTLIKSTKNREETKNNLLEELLQKFEGNEGNLFTLFQKPKFFNISLYQLGLQFKNFKSNDSAEEFLNFLTTKMTDVACLEAEILTRKQSDCNEWFILRYGRITASIIYECARSKTFSGSLKEKILGATPPLQNEAVIRGKKLENAVIKKVCEMKKIKIRQSGLLLDKKYPIFGASPDGISEEHIIEIKCPFKEKNIERYVSKGVITRKFYFQMQLQMLFAKKNKGFFCIASPNFENNNEVQIIELIYDWQEVEDIMEQAKIFWINSIYPVLQSL